MFIDDNATNVDEARSVGLAAIHWDFTRGHAELLELLRAHGVRVGEHLRGS